MRSDKEALQNAIQLISFGYLLWYGMNECWKWLCHSISCRESLDMGIFFVKVEIWRSPAIALIIHLSKFKQCERISYSQSQRTAIFWKLWTETVLTMLKWDLVPNLIESFSESLESFYDALFFFRFSRHNQFLAPDSILQARSSNSSVFSEMQNWYCKSLRNKSTNFLWLEKKKYKNFPPLLKLKLI